MGILSKIFGDTKNATTIVDGAVKGLDAIFFTKEEKSQANQKLADWYLKYLSATQPQNLARRWIAIIIVILWAFLILLGIGFKILGANDIATFVFETLNTLVHQPFMLIMGFYFLTHVVRTYTDRSKSK